MNGSDALLVFADRLDCGRSPEIAAAREVVGRAAAHTRVCETCASFDGQHLIRDLPVVLDTVVDEQIDAAAIELAHELELGGICIADRRALR